VDLPIRTVVIDAGHGGRDTGAIGQAGGREKDIALDLARRLREKLAQRPDYRVFLVRETDAYMPLNERVSYVNSLDTDLFISLHTNELPGTSTDSLELYYFGPNPDPRTRNLAKLENRHWSYEISEYEERLNAPMRLEASKGFAESIRTSFLKSRQPEGRTTFKPIVGTAALVVLLGVKAPSVLVEIGTLSTQEGERSMNQPQYRENIATELANGITAYLNDQPRQ
jgi:N-acetylmuramoyl-L-alanine amidase